MLRVSRACIAALAVAWSFSESRRSPRASQPESRGPGCVKRSVCCDSRDKILRRLAGHLMKRFVEGFDRGQSTLFPASLDDYVTEDNPVRAVDVFVDSLELDKLGLVCIQPFDTGPPSDHPRTMLSIRHF
jgi:hypothetical protein